MVKWKTEVRKVSELKGWDKNPRKISADKLEELKRSIDNLGNFEPLVVDTDNTVISGNQRLKIAQETGQEEIEVSVPDRKLTDKEIKKIGLISNRHSGEWDMELLQDFEDVLQELGFDDLLGVSVDGFGEEFTLPDGDKAPFQQMTFTLADEQAEQVKNAIADIKQTEEYKYAETMGNENSNGNALYLIVMQWAEQRK
jgi:hypothetical protein